MIRFRKILNLILLVLVLADCVYSFYQFSHTKIDGDVARNVVPDSDTRKVLADPFGVKTITSDAYYAVPNRFFMVWTMHTYFHSVPFLLQNFMSPLDSVYVSCALAKLLVQVFLLVILSTYARFNGAVTASGLLFSVFMLTPFFQSAGYNVCMGIIDRATTYVFFYAFPLGLLGVYFLPFYRFPDFFNGRWSFVSHALLFGLSVVLAFSSPIVIAVMLLIYWYGFTVMFHQGYMQAQKLPAGKRIMQGFAAIPGVHRIHFILGALLCFYSLLVGSHNSENHMAELDIADRFVRLPRGVFNLLTQKLGLALLLILVPFNLWLVRRSVASDQTGMKRFAYGALILSFVYIMIIPLGGYRSYREDMVRYDTFMPVTMTLLILFGGTASLLVEALRGYKRFAYGIFLALIVCIYANADKPDLTDYLLERASLEEIRASEDSLVVVQREGTIMSWKKTETFEESRLNSEMLFLFGVTDQKKLFRQQ